MRLRRTRVRFPPPPRMVRLHTCSSERPWRCADTSRDTSRTRKDTGPRPDAGVLVWRRRPRAARSRARLDQVEELLTALPSTLGGLRELVTGVRTSFDLWGPAPTAAGGRRRRRPPPSKISIEKFLCPAVSRWYPLSLAGTRWVPLDTTSDLGRCHTGAPPWMPCIPTTTPCSKPWSVTGAAVSSRTSWPRATAAAGAAIRSGSVVSSSPVPPGSRP